MEIIGLGYKSGVGKDLCANYIAEQYSYKKISFATILKETAQVLYGDIGVRGPSYYEGPFKEERRKELYGPYALNIVQVWVHMNKLCDLNPRLWIDATLGLLDPEGRYVIADCRKPLEIQAIKEKGGNTIWIDRDVPDKKEAEIDKWLLGKEHLFDYKIYNNGHFMETAIQLGGTIESINATLE